MFIHNNYYFLCNCHGMLLTEKMHIFVQPGNIGAKDTQVFAPFLKNGLITLTSLQSNHRVIYMNIINVILNMFLRYSVKFS